MANALSVFLDFNLPNATTWFYFSFLLALALFFKFGRLLSIRNGDVVVATEDPQIRICAMVDRRLVAQPRIVRVWVRDHRRIVQIETCSGHFEAPIAVIRVCTHCRTNLSSSIPSGRSS